MRSELKRLHYELGVTTVYVTHDQTEAMTMASCVVVMKDGRLQQIDPPHVIYHKPANLFVAEFVGMPRINTLPAQVVQKDGKSWLETDDFQFELAWKPSQGEVNAAVRPEDVSISTEPEANTTEFQVYAILPSGPELYIQVKRGSRTLMIRETRQLDLKMDQPVWVNIKQAALNLYDKGSGLLLTPEDHRTG